MEIDTRKRIEQVFEHFDYEGRKTIEWERLVKVIKILNPEYAHNDAELALTADGRLQNGVIAYKEFVEWAYMQPDGATIERTSNKIAETPEIEEIKASPDEEAKIAAMKKKTRRPGVAAESMDNAKVENYEKPVHAKEDAAKELIRKTLQENEKMKVLCGHLEGKDLADLINAFQPREFSDGAEIIVQGSAGDCLYIINDGQVDVFVARPNADGKLTPGERGSKVVTFGPGNLFGELALLYSAPRAATVIVATPNVKLWALDQLDFKMLLAQSAQQQYALYEGWLRQVDLLKTLNYYELSRLSEALESTLFDADEVIIKQGESGSDFFLLEDGTCAAFIEGADGEKEVKRYETQGDYFGELALLTSAPRKATVRATKEGCVVASINREVFVDILGPLSDILRTHADKYPQYADILRVAS